MAASRLRISRFDEFAPTKTERKGFDCGDAGLTDWLTRFAGQSMDSRDAVTYLLHRDGERTILGYFSLSAGAVAKADATAAVARRAPDPVPVVLLGRLAVARTEQRQGLGSVLLSSAIARAVAAAKVIGARCVLVHAIDDAARRFYADRGFDASPVSPLTPMLHLDDVEASAGLQRGEP